MCHRAVDLPLLHGEVLARHARVHRNRTGGGGTKRGSLFDRFGNFQPSFQRFAPCETRFYDTRHNTRCCRCCCRCCCFLTLTLVKNLESVVTQRCWSPRKIRKTRHVQPVRTDCTNACLHELRTMSSNLNVCACVLSYHSARIYDTHSLPSRMFTRALDLAMLMEVVLLHYWLVCVPGIQVP